MILFDEEDKNDLSISKGDAIWAWGHNPTFFNISSIDTFRPPQHRHKTTYVAYFFFFSRGEKFK